MLFDEPAPSPSSSTPFVAPAASAPVSENIDPNMPVHLQNLFLKVPIPVPEPPVLTTQEKRQKIATLSGKCMLNRPLRTGAPQTLPSRKRGRDLFV